MIDYYVCIKCGHRLGLDECTCGLPPVCLMCGMGDSYLPHYSWEEKDEEPQGRPQHQPGSKGVLPPNENLLDAWADEAARRLLPKDEVGDCVDSLENQFSISFSVSDIAFLHSMRLKP